MQPPQAPHQPANSTEEIERAKSGLDATFLAFCLVLAALVAGGLAGYANARRLDENRRLVEHSHEVLVGLETLLSTVQDAETGQRGYLLTEDQRYLEPYRDALKRLDAQFAHVKDLTSDNRQQQERLAILGPRIDARMEVLKRSIDSMEHGRRADAVDAIRSGIGKTLMDGVRADIAVIQDAEHALLRERADSSIGSYYATVWSIVLSTIVGILLVGVVFFLAQRSLRQQKHAASALASQKEHLRVTLASIGDAVICTDAEGKITYLNPVAQTLTGCTLERARGRALDDIFQIVNEQTRQPVESPVVRALHQGVIVGLANHTVLIGCDGKERPIDDSAAPIRSEEGDIIGCVLVFRDVTERRTYERELESREREFRTLAESIPQLAWMANPDGNVFWYNRRWYDYTGTSFEDMQQNGWEPVHDPEVLPAVLERWEQAVATGRPLGMVHPLRGKDGTFRRFLTQVVPLTNAEGEVERWFGSSTDIHEQQESQDKMRQLAADLSAAHRRKDEFLATLAHELRNPLAPIRNGLQLLHLNGGDPATGEKVRDMMERQLNQLVRLVDDLLDVSRISLGKIELRREPLSLALVIGSAVETSRPLIEAMGHQLTVTLPEDSIVVDADMTRLAQVFVNLLNNAAKYSARGSRIHLAATLHGSEVAISVRDNGIGIAADHLPGIFELFSQLDHSIERAQGGLGIGLTLVKRLVEMHDGTIEAASDGPGRGSEFTVRLPVVVSQFSDQSASEETRPSALQSSLRILIVDDNRDSADTLAMVLKVRGYQTLTAYDGAEALAAAESFRPDVILLDIGLPKLSGYEVCRRLRGDPDFDKVVIVAQTGWGQDEDRERTQEAGFDFHLVKPVDPAALIKLLSEVASGAGHNA